MSQEWAPCEGHDSPERLSAGDVKDQAIAQYEYSVWCIVDDVLYLVMKDQALLRSDSGIQLAFRQIWEG
jgi:hypothetical protein